MSGGKFFLDTNVLVYAMLPQEPAKAARARDLIRQAGQSGQGIISLQVAQEFLNVALRKFRRALTAAEADQYAAQVLGPLIEPLPALPVLRAAIALYRDHEVAWHDALIVAAAREADCRTLYSEDLQHGQRFGPLQVLDPFRG